MILAVLGLNHKTVSLDVREGFAITKESARSGLVHIGETKSIQEAVILSTCNRTEIYAVFDEHKNGREALKQLFLKLSGNSEYKKEYFFYYEGTECIRHLFNVAAGLDSMLIGESEILNQVKVAYTEALAVKATRTILNTLFHRAIRVGKRVRSETFISESAVSVSYLAVKTARKLMDGLENRSALLLGAGEAGELLGRHLQANGLSQLYIANRHQERAESLSQKIGGTVVPFHGALELVPDVDLIVTATGATQYIVKEWELREIMANREYRPLVLMDIAVPSDVEPTVRNIRNVTLYDMDDLQAIVEKNLETRKEEGARAEVIVEEELISLEERFTYLSSRPTMVSLSDKAEEIRNREYRHVLSKCPDLSERQEKYVEEMTKRIVRKLLREPMMQLNDAAGTEKEAQNVSAVTRLFRLDSEQRRMS